MKPQIISSVHPQPKSNFKKWSKKIMIATLLLISISSFAQQENQSYKKTDKPKKEKQTPEQRTQTQLNKWTADLSLTSQQQEQIKLILAEQNAKLEALRIQRMDNNQRTMSPEERETFKKKWQDEKKATETKLQAILTPEQFKKLKESQEAKKAMRRKAIENFENNKNNGGNSDKIDIENR